MFRAHLFGLLAITACMSPASILEAQGEPESVHLVGLHRNHDCSGGHCGHLRFGGRRYLRGSALASHYGHAGGSDFGPPPFYDFGDTNLQSLSPAVLMLDHLGERISTDNVGQRWVKVEYSSLTFTLSIRTDTQPDAVRFWIDGNPAHPELFKAQGAWQQSRVEDDDFYNRSYTWACPSLGRMSIQVETLLDGRWQHTASPLLLEIVPPLKPEVVAVGAKSQGLQPISPGDVTSIYEEELHVRFAAPTTQVVYLDVDGIAPIEGKCLPNDDCCFRFNLNEILTVGRHAVRFRRSAGATCAMTSPPSATLWIDYRPGGALTHIRNENGWLRRKLANEVHQLNVQRVDDSVQTLRHHLRHPRKYAPDNTEKATETEQKQTGAPSKKPSAHGTPDSDGSEEDPPAENETAPTEQEGTPGGAAETETPQGEAAQENGAADLQGSGSSDAAGPSSSGASPSGTDDREPSQPADVPQAEIRLSNPSGGSASNLPVPEGTPTSPTLMDALPSGAIDQSVGDLPSSPAPPQAVAPTPQRLSLKPSLEEVTAERLEKWRDADRRAKQRATQTRDSSPKTPWKETQLWGKKLEAASQARAKELDVLENQYAAAEDAWRASKVVSTVTFEAAAYFSRDGYGTLGQLDARRGLVLQEGMQFLTHADGNWELKIPLIPPTSPAVLHLQLQFRTADGRWKSISLQPVELTTSASTQLHLNGFSPVLRREAGYVTEVRRRGSVRFGHGYQGLTRRVRY